MELFLNLCWLALLLPAYLLWRRRVSSAPWTRASFVIVCTLGCALVMLFPVVSASDDLHAVGQAMEESKRSFRHNGHCACHVLSHSSLPVLSASASLRMILEPVGAVLPFSQPAIRSLVAFACAGRAPPSVSSLSV
ncbi:MAG: hypothetical protein WAL71_12730 [Terriglobales bacterium]|jgi:hypothetical protein